jgi:hypothetical protein
LFRIDVCDACVTGESAKKVGLLFVQPVKPLWLGVPPVKGWRGGVQGLPSLKNFSFP